MGAYYNEIDPQVAAWLRDLITQGLIADGEVDTRSVVDVSADDVRRFAQCHFFAGIGGWAYALRLAGWPDVRPVWTGSCPCQPFSSAGAQAGGDDPRHLWPAWFRLIRECRPAVVFGEQVESALNHGWFDLVCDDLEREGYAVGACSLPAASVGAPHIRQRLWFVAESEGQRHEWSGSARRRWARLADDRADGELADADGGGTRKHARELSSDEGEHDERPQDGDHAPVADGAVMRPGPVADDDEQGRHRVAAARLHERRQTARGGTPAAGDADRPPGHDPDRCGEPRGMADAQHQRRQRGTGARRQARRGAEQSGGLGDDVGPRLEGQLGDGDHRHQPGRLDPDAARSTAAAGGAGFWSACDWLPCRDGKARPVEPGTFPLADGVPGRVGRLRGYGNAIVPQVAAQFIDAYLDTQGERTMRRTDSDDGRPVLTGTVKTIALGKGFGFLAGTDGVEYFFHKSDTPDFDALDRGVAVRFIPGSGPKGPRAESVILA